MALGLVYYAKIKKTRRKSQSDSHWQDNFAFGINGQQELYRATVLVYGLILWQVSKKVYSFIPHLELNPQFQSGNQSNSLYTYFNASGINQSLKFSLLVARNARSRKWPYQLIIHHYHPSNTVNSECLPIFRACSNFRRLKRYKDESKI